MPNIRSAIKRMRQNSRRRIENRSKRSTMRTAIKKFNEMLAEGNIEAVQAALPETLSVIGKCAQKGIIHKKTAARYHSRLSLKVNALQTPDAPAAN